MNLIALLYVAFAAVLFSACGTKEAPRPVQMPPVIVAPPIQQPMPQVTPRPGQGGTSGRDVVVRCSRRYEPDAWDNYDGTLSEGLWQAPEIIEVTRGNAGAGWLAVSIADVTYCYQGIATQDTPLSPRFLYRGAKPLGAVCAADGIGGAQRAFILGRSARARASIQGGFCPGGKCPQTDVEFTIQWLRGI